MVYPENTYIIAIGIDKYQLEDLGSFRAGSCKNDCNDLVQLLTKNFEGFQLYGEQLTDGKATKTSITALIESFIEDTGKNNLNNNLIIYFSGHGATVPEGVGSEIGCWVPHDCKQLHKRQVLSNLELINLFRDINTRDFLLISDSCNSGQLFMHVVHDVSLNASAPAGPILSRWGMVSSSREELSLVKGRNSFFTGKLLEIIRQMDQKEFTVEDLNGKLRKAFSNTTVQHPVCTRLQFQPLQNSGDMFFKELSKVALLKSAKKLLATELHELNYHAQEKELKTFAGAAKKHLVVFSGNSKSALSHLSYRAYFNAKMRENNTTREVIIPIIHDSEESHLLGMLNQCLPVSFEDLKTAGRYLTERLKIKSLLFEIQVSDPQLFLLSQKKQILKDIRQFLQEVEMPANNNVLVFFILDTCDSVYNEPSQADAHVNFVNTTKVSVISREDFDVFFENFRKNFRSDAGVLEEWDKVMEEEISTAVHPLLGDPHGHPETVITAICEAAACKDIIVKLLNPLEN